MNFNEIFGKNATYDDVKSDICDIPIYAFWYLLTNAIYAKILAHVRDYAR